MKRIPAIDFVRFASIFVVMGGHFFPRWIAGAGYAPEVRQIILNSFLYGANGVTCFFVVSGFLITQMLAEGWKDFSGINLKAFYVKRAARIFPLLSLVILTGVLMDHFDSFFNERWVQYNPWNVEGGFGWNFWLALLTFNFNWYLVARGAVGVGMHWSVLWSLAVEEQFYLCYPIVLKLLKKPGRVVGFLAGVVLSAVLFRGMAYFILKRQSPWMQEASFAAFDQIAVGGLLYFLRERCKEGLGRRPWLCWVLLLSGVTLCLGLYVRNSADYGWEFVPVPTLLALGCALAILGGLQISFLNSSWAFFLSWPGKLSYGCYLWNPTLIFILMPLLVRIGGLWALAFLFTCIWVFSFFSYVYFEMPMNNRIRAVFKLKPSQSL